MSTTGHPEDLLSAHVDGELDPAASAEVEAHLAGCAACRRAQGDLREARSLLRSLPAEDAAPVIEGFLTRHRAVIRLGTGFVTIAAVVLAALGLNAATHRAELVPDVAAMVQAHVAAAPHGVGDLQRHPDAPYDAPAGLAHGGIHLSRDQAWDGTDLGAVVYRDGERAVTVFQQPGRLDWEALPAGRTEELAGVPVWLRPGEPVVAVAEKGDLVVTVVAPDHAGALATVASLPAWERRGAWDRLHDACQRFTQVFALGD